MEVSRCASNLGGLVSDSILGVGPDSRTNRYKSVGRFDYFGQSDESDKFT